MTRLNHSTILLWYNYVIQRLHKLSNTRLFQGTYNYVLPAKVSPHKKSDEQAD